MIRNKVLWLYTKTMAADSEGIQTAAWTAIKQIPGNFQPRKLTETEAMIWGLSGAKANAKVFLFDNDAAVIEGAEFRDGADRYDVRGLNQWPGHSEAILIPVQGV